ncbi:MAG: SEL1-like repeat protein [bacterium]|tara:strand:- start:6193 stop:7122 length:930 start_codon:yes stop_codon:yes gene_type:complete
MLKNQGFIYITHCHLSSAPLIKINYDPRPTLPNGFMETHSALAVWPLTGKAHGPHRLLDQLHANLIQMGLAFTIPKVYQTNFIELVSFIDEWLEVDRHFEGTSAEFNHEAHAQPLKSNFIPESSIEMRKLGDHWLTNDPAYECSASAAYYRGMLHSQENCQFQLARCYEEGVGVEINYTRAKELLTTLKDDQYTYPILLRLSYKEKNKKAIEEVKNSFFMRAPLPLPGKGDQFGVFHQTLLEMLVVSFDQVGDLDIWFNSWELVSPYREEILSLSEVRVMDHLDAPDSSQTRAFHDMLTHIFQTYRCSA